MEYFTLLDLAREPFSNSPDPDFFYGSHQHLECLQKLELTLRLRQGLTVVIGDVGTGKTTLSRQLLRKLSGKKDAVRASLILDPSFTDSREFLGTVCASFGVASSLEDSDRQVKENIKNMLFDRAAENNEILVLVIDEGQKLSSPCLEILRELLNYETNNAKLLQIVIFAQKEFEQTMAAHPNFTDRIATHYDLPPLSFADTRRMIRFRLQQARTDEHGKNPELFSFWSLLAIYWITRGYPRKIVMLCSKTLLSLIIQNGSRVTTSLVLACTRRLPLAAENDTKRLSKKTTGAGLVALAALILFFWHPADLNLLNTTPPAPRQEAPRPQTPPTVTATPSQPGIEEAEQKQAQSTETEPEPKPFLTSQALPLKIAGDRLISPVPDTSPPPPMLHPPDIETAQEVKATSPPPAAGGPVAAHSVAAQKVSDVTTPTIDKLKPEPVSTGNDLQTRPDLSSESPANRASSAEPPATVVPPVAVQPAQNATTQKIPDITTPTIDVLNPQPMSAEDDIRNRIDRSSESPADRASSAEPPATVVPPVAVQPVAAQPVAVQPVAVQPVAVQPEAVENHATLKQSAISIPVLKEIPSHPVVEQIMVAQIGLATPTVEPLSPLAAHATNTVAAPLNTSQEEGLTTDQEDMELLDQGLRQIFLPVTSDKVATYDDTTQHLARFNDVASDRTISSEAFKKTPRRPLLGTVNFTDEAGLGLMVVSIYGHYASSHVAAIIRANPTIVDVNNIPNGLDIRFPGSLPYRLETASSLYWVLLAQFDDLTTAYAWLRKTAPLPAGPPLLIPHLDHEMHLGFSAVSPRYFTSRQQAEEAKKALPESLRQAAAVQENWPAETLLLGKHLGEPF